MSTEGATDSGSPAEHPVEAGGRPFLGRAREVEQVAQGMAGALAGRGQLILLMGEPGIGKTRLCDEITTTARTRGMPVMWGRAWEAGGAPAYWPWLEVLSGLARLVDGPTLGAALGEGAALVADLVPEIRPRLPHLTPPALATAHRSDDEARVRLWRAVVSLVRKAADASGGLVLVFDDLHSTDRSSLLMLYALARELRTLPVLVVATCRDVEARLDAETGQLVAKLAREATTLGLTRLDRATVAELLRRRRPGTLPPDVESRLLDSTQGNPLFIEEMLRLLDEEGEASITVGVVPSGVREVIRQRLDRVADDTRDLLDLAAVAGDVVSLGLLAAAARREASWVRAQITAAVRAGLLVESAGSPRFSHSLMREVLYRDLAPEKRQGLHREVGRAIEELARGKSGAPPLMELAHHAIEAASISDELPRAVDFAERAASRAIELTAAEEAIAVLERVEDAVRAAGDPPALRARVLLSQAEARIRRGEVVAGRSLCCEVATLARALGDPALLANAALIYGRIFTFAVVDPVMVQMLEDALEAQPPGDSAPRARLLARLAGALQPATVAAEPVRIAREAIATARRLGDRRCLLETMHDGLSALMDVVDPRECRALNLEVEALAVLEGDRERLLRTHARLALVHMALGELPHADARTDSFEKLARELRASWILWRVPLFRAVRAVIDGRFADAERLEEEARGLAGGVQDPQGERALILYHEGLLRVAERHDEMRALEPRARQARGMFQNGPAWQALGSGLLFTRLEDADAARAHLEALPADLCPPLDNLFALFSIAECAAFVGQPELVASLYRLLSPWSDQYVMLGMTQIQWEGPVTRLLALLAARLGDWEQAASHFQDALDRLTRLGARPYLARTQYEFARALLHRRRPEELARAGALLEQAGATAAELEMTGLIRLIQQRRADAGLSPPAPGQSAASGEPGATAAAVVESPPPLLTLLREGEYWTGTLASGRSFRLKDSLGLRYLDRLMTAPGQEVHVLDLVTWGAGGSAAAVDDAPIDRGDAGELLDETARAHYRHRLEALRDTLSEAESFGDQARASRAREEIDFLGAELARAVGLGGRGRRAASATERARSAVQRRIRNALDRIAEAVPETAPALNAAVKTGIVCVYRPPPPRPGHDRPR